MNFLYSSTVESSFSNIIKRSASFVLALFLLLSPIERVFAQEVVAPIDTTTVVTSDPTVLPTDPAPLAPEPIITPTDQIIPTDTAVVTEQSPVAPLPSEEAIPPSGEIQALAMGAEPSVSNNAPKDSITAKLNIGTSPLTGSLQYQIPIVVPPGRNGLTPDLSLVYSSEPSDQISPYGYGWSDNIPYIERLNKKGTNKLYSENAFFSTFDGELWPNDTATNTESYGARYESGTFLKYEFKNNAYWQVTDKQGVVYKFGSTTSARLDNPSNALQVSKWMLEEVRDPNGNYIKYEYTKNGGQVYPLRITYTGNGMADGIFTVNFVTEVRSYVATSSKSGFNVVANYRISEIRTEVNGAWAKKYTLSYTLGDNGRRQILSSITESGRDESGNIITLPSTNLIYHTQTTVDAWQATSLWQSPEDFVDASGNDLGVRVLDINGDARVDILVSRSTTGTSTYSKVYVNDGSTWNYDASWSIPVPFTLDYKDRGVRFTDVNGDGLTDILSYKEGSSTAAYLNTGAGWSFDGTWNPPLPFVSTTTTEDKGVQVMDVNGDGLPDILQGITNLSGATTTSTYLNNGAGWTATTSFQVPLPFIKYVGTTYVDYGTRFAEVNGDGLIDLIISSPSQSKVYVNSGTGWTLSGWTPPVQFAGANGEDFGVRLFDHNGDGLTDVSKYSVGVATGYINNGQNGWTSVGVWVPKYQYVDSSYRDYGARVVDVDGDGLDDVLYACAGSRGTVSNLTKRVDLLAGIRHTEGLTTAITYKASASYFDGSTLSNPRTPFNIDTVREFSVSDGLDTSGTFQYTYGGGRYYFNDPFDRRFAGYATTTVTDPVNAVTKSYFHQGNSTASALGEYSDDASKIGRVYRTEVYDTNANLYSLAVTKWDEANLSNGRVFVKPMETTELLYDGDADHRDRVTAYRYIDSTGNIAEQVEYGEVVANTDGSYSDTGSDTRMTSFTYATNTTDYIIGLPSTKVTKNNSGATVTEDHYYYDTLSLGSVTNGNLTKSESWATSSTYIDTERTYNSYGLVTQELDPRNKATNFVYDTYNLYPATTTNPLSQSTTRLYDYTSGKVRQVTDSNNRTYITVYDALDRVKEEQIPDHVGTPTSLVTKAMHEYTDTVGSRRVKKTENLNTGTSTESYSYLDGLSRVIQERREMETANTYSVRDLKYNRRGDLQVETLPFESTGSSRTSFNNDPVLQILYEYDPLGRLASTTNVVGTESHRYDEWKDTITDRDGKQRSYTFDASNNLVQVEENNGTSTYTTTYTYDAMGKLAKITDALGNVRNFAYDGLGRRISAEDLHAVGDGTYGVWTYTYDDAGNVTAILDPNSQTTNYTYDDISRVLTEDFTGQGGTEISYGYDVCAEGKGRLCSATSTGGVTQIIYDALGELASESKVISGATYTTSYLRDRLGNVTKITLPDNREISYMYNSAGQLETVSTKPNGGSTESVVTDIDYGPHGQVTFRKYANGVESANFYDSSELYRLRKILTTTATTTGSGLSSFESMMMTGPTTESAPFASNFALSPTGYMTDTTFLDAQSSTSTEVATESTQPQVPPGYEELISLRTVNSKTFEQVGSAPDQTVERVTRMYSKPVHYDNGGSLDEINTALVETPTGWEMMRAPYRATVAKDSNTSIFSFDNSGLVHSLELMNGVKNKLGEKNTKATEWKNKEVIFNDVLGNGVGLHVRTDDEAIHKEVFIDSLASLGNLTKEYYELSFKIKSNKPVTLTVEGKTLKSGGTITSSNIASIRSQDGTVSYIWPPYAEDSSTVANPEYRIPISIQYTMQKDGILFTKRIPKTWLLSAQYPVHTDATISYNPPAGDGYILTQPYPSAWSTQHADTVGRSADYTATEVPVNTSAYNTSGGSVGIARAFLPFDTSSLPDSVNILSATLNLYVATKTDEFNDQYGYVTVYQSTQATTTSLANADINDCGNAETNPTKGSNDVDITTVVTSSYSPFVLNGTGLGWVNKTGSTKLCVREGHDVTNHEPIWNGMTWKHSTLRFATSKAEGVVTDPYLDIVYTVVNHVPTPATALLTEGATNPVGITDTTPEFSAIYNDSDIGDIATHYRIQVSTSTTDWSAPVWDTTRLALASSTPRGSRIADISYSTVLMASTTYYWRIKFWDQYGYEGSWSSETTTFIPAVTMNTVIARFYAGAGDGLVQSQPYPSAWATQHADTVGRSADYTSTSAYANISAYNTNGGSLGISKAFLPFDTSSLPDNAIITNATVNLYVTAKQDAFNDQYGYFAIHEGREASPSTVVNADINDCGNTETNPAKGSDNLDITNITTGQYNVFTLNATGTPWISKTGYSKLCTREGHDAQNVAPVWNNNTWIASHIAFNTSEATGTTTDPYLEITYQTTGSSSPSTTPAVALIQDIAYEYDAVGNITKMTDVSSTTAQKTVVYTYDDLYRLTNASTTQAQNTPYVRTYTYNPIGNITTSDLGTYTYAGTGYTNPHAVTGIGATAYTYDNNGNTLTAGANGYAYDHRNRMTTSGTGSATTSYAYDHTTERLSKTVGGITTIYPHDSWNKGGSTTTIHITDPRGIELATIEGNGLSTTTVYSHQDHLGSTNVLTTNIGTLKEVSDYYPYGAPRVQTTYAGTREQRGYLSEDYDTDSSLSYLNARYYAGDRGQFLSQDPVFWGNQNLGNPQSMNSYSYAENNPVNKKDPTGLVTFSGTKEAALKGIIKSLKNIVNLLTAIKNDPVGSAKSVAKSTGNGVKNVVLNPVGMAIDGVISAKNTTQRFINGNDATQDQMLGNGLIRGAGFLLTRGAEKYLPNETLICRGGRCTADEFIRGTGVKTNSDGTLSGVSVVVGINGESKEQLLKMLPPSSGGVGGFTTVLRVANTTAEMIQTGSRENHYEMSGLSPDQFSELFK